jgi:hypothetical protein
MHTHDPLKERRRTRATSGNRRKFRAKSASETPPTGRAEVPEIYQVVVECRHEREQQAVFERMRAEGYRCRVLTL